MRFFCKMLVWVGLGLGIHACTLVDNYILGKDNTLQPKPLPELHAKLHLKQLWSAKVGDGHQPATYYKLKPVTANKIIYTTDAHGYLSAVSTRGNVLWTKSLAQGIVSGPTVVSNKLIVGTDSGTVLAMSVQNGQKLWEQRLSGDVLAKPLVVGQLVIAKTMDGHLYALDLETGRSKWTIEHGAPNLILKASSAPVMMGNTLVVGYSDGKLDAVNVAEGRVIWQRGIVYANGASDIERLVDIDADPIVHHGWICLASYQGTVGAFDVDNGEFIWSKPASIYKNMAVDGDTLYVTDRQDVLWAYQLSTGQIKWKQTALKGYGVTEPVVFGSRIVVADKAGQIHVLARSNGNLIGREMVGAPVYISPAVSHGHLLIISSDGILHAYEAHSL